MFIGHYGVGLALKKADKTISLGLLFLAVQFVDILWTIFVLLGIEKFQIVPGITASNPMDFISYPFTHSLVASFIWAGAIYFLFRFLPAKQGSQKNKVALILGIAVLSHFFLDLVVHRPDLPLLADYSPKIGLGLWNYTAVSYTIETLIFMAGLFLYLKSTRGTSFAGKYGMIIFGIILIILNLANLFSPPPNNTAVIAITGLIMYLLFAGIALWLDKRRSSA